MTSVAQVLSEISPFHFKDQLIPRQKLQTIPLIGHLEQWFLHRASHVEVRPYARGMR